MHVKPLLSSNSGNLGGFLNYMSKLTEYMDQVFANCVVNYNNMINPWYLHCDISMWNDLPAEVKDDMIRAYRNAPTPYNTK